MRTDDHEIESSSAKSKITRSFLSAFNQFTQNGLLTASAVQP